MILDFIREHQLNIMLCLSSISGIIAIFTMFTGYISKSKKKALLIMSISAFILLLTDRYAYIYRGDISTLGYYMVRICNYFVFATSLSLIYGFNEYLISLQDDSIDLDYKKTTKILFGLRTVLITGEIILIISQFTNLYYYFDINNNYHRGNLFIICYIIPLISLLTQLLIILIYKRNTKKHIFVPLLLFAILPIIATLIQIYAYGVSLTNISSVFVVILLYVFTIYDANILIEAKGKLEKELHIARDIQLNEVPNTFPSFPERKEFDLYAIMNPAKEVGGDFYDYFLLDDNHLGMVIADVSGKGVPAALNMVKSKLLLKGIGIYLNDPAKALDLLNNGFIDNNKLDMFVTAWFGILEITTGKLKFANAGHEDIIIYNEKTGYDLFETKHGIPIGVKKNYQYTNYETKLNKGDKIFLYTDGVVESINTNRKQYGINNLLKTLNKNKEKSVEDIIKSVNSDLNDYSKGCEQFDDITMLCVELTKSKDKNDIIHLNCTFKADVKEINNVYEYFTDTLAESVGSQKLQNYYVVIDEIFSNIAKYGYKDITDGRDEYVNIDLTIDTKKRNIKIVFEDNGVKFNPLTIMKQNMSSSAKDRKIGGLGIFIVKEMMDKVSYEYKKEKNFLTIEKSY